MWMFSMLFTTSCLEETEIKRTDNNLQALKKMLKLSHVLFMTGVLIFAACSKKPEQIGADLQPDQDRVQVFRTDTLAITAYSVVEDSIRTDEPANALLGSIADPVFGTMVSGFYTQFRLSTNAPDFGENPILDSLVLQLAYAGYYGDTTTVQTMRVFEIGQSLYLDSSYYSTRHIPYGTNDFANRDFSPNPKKGFPWQGDTLQPMIRVRLSDQSPELGNKILNAPAAELENNEKFVEYIKGLFITVDPVTSGGAISYFDLPSNLSRLTLYYKNNSRDSLRYELLITAQTPRYNRFDHFGYANAASDFKNQVIEGDTTLGNTQLYLQTMGGVKTFIRFPDLRNFSNNLGKKVIINEAKLIFSGYEAEPDLAPPAQMALVLRTEDPTRNVIMPDQLEGEAYFGGNYKKSVNEVHFRITRYVQNLVQMEDDDTDYGLFAIITGASSRASRWVVNGANPSDPETKKPLRLQIIYSTID